VKLSEAVGLAFVLGGFLVLFRRGLAGLFDVSFTFVTGVGVLALILGLNYFNVGRQADRRATEPPDVELRYEATRPGTETDELLADAAGLSRAGVAARREFRERLHEATTETLLRRGDYPSEAAATAAVDDGEWTTDPVASWFLADTTDDAPLSVRLRGVVNAESGFVFAARRTVAAVAAVQRGEQPAATADASGSVLTRLQSRLGIGRETADTETGGAADPSDGLPSGTGLPGQLGGATADGSTDDADTDHGSTAPTPPAATETRGATGTDHEDAWKLVEGES
jgi:hypothetical protein